MRKMAKEYGCMEIEGRVREARREGGREKEKVEVKMGVEKDTFCV